MNADAWQRMEQVFFEALALEGSDRTAFLDRACAGDPALRKELDSILAAHDAAGFGYEDTQGLEAESATADTLTGSHIGVYRLEERVGSGGMGEVYRARRTDGVYDQDVAIKVVRSSLPAEEMTRRFRLERQVLARLQHPNVAPLLDGGVTSDGRPYLVMHYVEGAPITEYADRERLGVPDRLRLFATVCRTVHFAHRNLIVHRDLKPSNILVGAEGHVRLLDFGIAKLLDPEGAGFTVPVTEELLLLTPDHAAPEQVLGEPVTTATDIYALGVLLHELLTGTRPFGSIDSPDRVRAVCEIEPTRPSAAEASEDTAARRRTQPSALRHTLRGDLDAMVLMALRKEPQRRYASAEQFAEDVERFLDGRPVLAQRDSLGYRTRKFVRRNRIGVGALIAFVLLLASATITVAVQSRQRAAALRQAQLERDTSTRLAEFLVSVFDASDPASTRGREVAARELLDRAAARLEADLSQEPRVRADMAMAMGRAYGGLGLAEPSTDLFAQAVRIRRSLEEPSDPAALADALQELGRARAAVGRTEEGIALLEESLALREQTLGPDDPAVAAALTWLGRMWADLDAWDASLAHLRRAESVLRAQETVDSRALAEALRFQWVAIEGMDGPVEDALAATEAAMAAVRSLPDDDRLAMNVAEDYALTLDWMGLPDSAAAIHRSLLERREGVFGPDHPDVAFSLYNLGRVLLNDLGRAEDALPLLVRAQSIRESAFGPDHPLVAVTLHQRAFATAFTGDLALSASLAQRAVDIHRAALAEGSVDAINVLELLVQLRSLLGERETALDGLERLLDLGWTNAEILENPPFDNVRDDPRFRRLKARAAGG